MVTDLSWIPLSSSAFRTWPLTWGLIYMCKDWIHRTIAQIFETTKQQVVKQNELSSVKAVSSLVSLSHQSVQIKDVLVLIIRTTCTKFLSLSPSVLGTPHKFSGPLLFMMKGISHLRGRTTEGKPERPNLHGKRKPFNFPKRMPRLSSVLLSVNS